MITYMFNDKKFIAPSRAIGCVEARSVRTMAAKWPQCDSLLLLGRRVSQPRPRAASEPAAGRPKGGCLQGGSMYFVSSWRQTASLHLNWQADASPARKLAASRKGRLTVATGQAGLQLLDAVIRRTFGRPLRAYSSAKRPNVVPANAAYGYIRDLNPAQKHCLQKFINLCMIDGKKNKSQKIISNTLCRLAKSEGAKRSGLIFLMKAIFNVKPIIEVKKVRISGSTQFVPSIISKNRQETLAIRWIVEAAIKRRNTKKSMSLDQCLLAELMDARSGIGSVRKRRDDLHKLAESNRGFAHYRWW